MPFVRPRTPPPPPPVTTRSQPHFTDEPGPSTSISSRFPPSASTGSPISSGGSPHPGSSSSLQGSVAGNTSHTDPIPPSLPPAGKFVSGAWKNNTGPRPQGGAPTSLHKIVEEGTNTAGDLMTRLDGLRREINGQLQEFQTLVDDMRSKNPLTVTPEEKIRLQSYNAKFRAYHDEILTADKTLTEIEDHFYNNYHILAMTSDDKNSIAAINNYSNQYKYKNLNDYRLNTDTLRRITRILNISNDILNAPASPEKGDYATVPSVP